MGSEMCIRDSLKIVKLSIKGIKPPKVAKKEYEQRRREREKNGNRSGEASE